MKNKKKSPKRLELDAEVVADLEAAEAESEGIHGGRSSGGGSVARGGGPASSGVT